MPQSQKHRQPACLILAIMFCIPGRESQFNAPNPICQLPRKMKLQLLVLWKYCRALLINDRQQELRLPKTLLASYYYPIKIVKK